MIADRMRWAPPYGRASSRPERLTVRSFMAVVASLGALALSMGTALADDGGLTIDVAGDTALLGEAPAGPILTGDLIEPGDMISGAVTVRSDRTGSLVIRAHGLRSDDNGCVEPEAEAGDASCGDGEGEMADAVVISVARGGAVLWHGTITQFATDGMTALTLAAGEAETFDLVATLPTATGNEVQGDSLAFELELSLDAPEVAGIVVERVDGFGILPVTGTGPEPLLLVGVGLVLSGLGIRRLRRRVRPWRLAATRSGRARRGGGEHAPLVAG